ncbi:hypothetical protein SHL15_0546 [Streptomyces hygroscopicus subsp. limoneus]|nr:hypothetical protein SHL15_0546 [Streptomyces hygroscopicus subsp. limoneus]
MRSPSGSHPSHGSCTSATTRWSRPRRDAAALLPEGATACIDADATDPDRVLAAAKTLDPARPTGLVPGDVLGHVAGHDQARSIVDRLMAALPPGGHLCVDDGPSGIDPAFEQAQEV